MSARFALLLPLALAWACGGAQPEPQGPPPGADPIRGVAGEDLFQRGLALANAGDLVRAEQYLAASIGRGADPERVLPPLMRVCVAASRLRAAIEYAKPYLDRHPDAWSLRYLVATLHLAIGEDSQARVELERVVREQPDQAAPHWTLAMMLRENAVDQEQARAHLERYLELEPQGVHAGDARAALAGDQVAPARVVAPPAAPPAPAQEAAP